MKTITRTRAVGGSLVVTIPAEIVKTQNLKENQVVEIEVKKAKQDFFGVLQGIGSFTEEDVLLGQLEE